MLLVSSTVTALPNHHREQDDVAIRTRNDQGNLTMLAGVNETLRERDGTRTSSTVLSDSVCQVHADPDQLRQLELGRGPVVGRAVLWAKPPVKPYQRLPSRP
jgi:hypothetical protein